MNRFKDKTLRTAYDNACESFRLGRWTRANGEPHRSATHRDAFWGGYLKDRRPPPTGSIAYACYRAGQDMAKPA